ncbi:MAG: CNNM domain-containing protein, partial [Halobaculum sp.]
MAALPPVVGAVVILVLVGLSAFFSSSETAIFTLTEESLTEVTDSDGDDRAALTVLRELKSDPHRLLVTLLVGNNVVNVAIASLSTALLLEYTPAGAAVTLATVLASFLVLIFGEIVPKSYGLANAHSGHSSSLGRSR